MPATDSTFISIGTIEQNGRAIAVRLRVAFDGIEQVGRLWFGDEGSEDAGLPDRAAIPGRTKEEVLELATRLTPHELGLRHRRALAEKRKYVKLRRVTEDILTKIRYMNQIAISMRAGLLDAEGADQELELTETQLHECIQRLRHNAGVAE